MSALRRIPISLLPRATAVRTLYTTPATLHRRAAASSEGGGEGGSGIADANKAAAGQSEDGITAKGRTGGGEPLGSSSENAPPKPKISNLSVPGNLDANDMTKEQKEEVDRHNKDFDARHDRGATAPEDKVNKSFWSGEGH